MAATTETEVHERTEEEQEEIHLPAPTAWPFLLACGITLGIAGLVTDFAVSVLGLILSVAAAVGWIREVLPHEHHVAVPIVRKPITITTQRPEVTPMDVEPHYKRAFVPVVTYPIRAGIWGGLAGSVAMAAVAVIYGVIYHGSIWYPINLLGSLVYLHPFQLSSTHLLEFNLVLFFVALAIHLITSLLVGLLYGTMLPMLPRHPIVLGGLIAPLMWSGLVYVFLGLVNPLLNQRINWYWFFASQVAFGIVAGMVVIRWPSIRVPQLQRRSREDGRE